MLIWKKITNFADTKVSFITFIEIMRQIFQFFKTYIVFVLLFIIQKPIFMLITNSSATQPIENLWGMLPSVIWHGLPLDLSMAGYLTAIPALLLIASVWIRQEIIRPILNTYFWIPAIIISTCFILNIVLYPYWNFPLDSTPIFYFFTSPADAFASVSIFFVLFGLVLIAICSVLCWFSLKIYNNKKRYYKMDYHRIRTSCILLVLTALLFIPIRGGVTVSTKHISQPRCSQSSVQLDGVGHTPRRFCVSIQIHEWRASYPNLQRDG